MEVCQHLDCQLVEHQFDYFELPPLFHSPRQKIIQELLWLSRHCGISEGCSACHRPEVFIETLKLVEFLILLVLQSESLRMR